jgi:subtilase family serine protease
VTTCYTPRQLEVAYGIRPLLERGIDGRGQTVVLPELAESQQSPPPGGLSDLRQDFASFDHLFGLPAPQLRVVSTFAGSADPWLANGEEVLDAEMVHTIAPGAALTIVLVRERRWTAPPARSRRPSPRCAWACPRAASSRSARPGRSAGSTASAARNWPA